jgi:hypothetical protein
VKPPKRKPAPPTSPAVPAKRRTQPYVPTKEARDTVSHYTRYGIPQLDLCAVLGISKATLHRHFRTEIDTAAARAIAKVAETLYNRAVAGDQSAIEFFLKNRARDQWNDRLTIVDGGKEVDPRTMSDADLDAEIARLRRRPAVVRAAKATTVH